jgi:ABC-type multidrug transport system, ATPase component
MAALAIEVERLVKRFGDLVAVDGIDLTVPTGTCLGLLGPNGAGKTTTVEILEGLQPATSGKVRVLGRTWAEDPGGIRGRIGATLQETRFHEKLTVEETLTLFRSFYPRGQAVESALAQVALEDKRDARVGTLSGGQKQRVAIARALLLNPRILILDDSTSSVDLNTEAHIQKALDSLMRGRTSFVIAQRISTVINADKIIVLDKGEIVAEGRHQDLMEDSPIYAEIYNSQILAHEKEGAL